MSGPLMLITAMMLQGGPAAGAPPAAATPAPDSPIPDSLAGHYYLEGVMETGSEMLLKSNGSFQWYLAYGALDLFADGDWRAEPGAIVLTSRKTENAPTRPLRPSPSPSATAG